MKTQKEINQKWNCKTEKYQLQPNKTAKTIFYITLHADTLAPMQFKCDKYNTGNCKSYISFKLGSVSKRYRDSRGA